MSKNFKLLMIGAMYENGGNTTHRSLDGHPQLFVYPFESQVGTKYVNDPLTTMFPTKYRWPTFLLEASPLHDYRAIIDEECKVRTRTPDVSKFRSWPMDLDDENRCKIYQDYVAKLGRSRGNNIEAFFRATFDAWRDYRRTGREQFYVGYSPIITVDADKILGDLPEAHVLHVVRNPWSAYADTKKRPLPLSLENYMLGWTFNQYSALLFQKKFPGRVHIVRAEDVMADSVRTLGNVMAELGLQTEPSLSRPTWNGNDLKEVYPWGTIRMPTPEQNLSTANELSGQEIEEIRLRTWQYLDVFGYGKLL
jgi:hypothetical protein